jgi:hypothetical protein
MQIIVSYRPEKVALRKATNNRMHSDCKKRRSFLALLFASGDAWRWAGKPENF